MTRHWIISVLLSFFVTFSLGEEPPTIETSLGKIKGHYKLSYGGRRFAAYEGIPYAKPPIGDLRFEEPIEAETWTGIWDATIVHTCLQLTWQSYQPTGSEDCLYLNVYVPDDDNIHKENLDVIVHIHGGAFMVGDPNLAGPEYLMDRNVIYVNMNYRLGSLGFLSTEDDIVPGNNGMKDQVLALRWVQKHIERFGGNPNSVTITGVSAGAGSVHLHYFSPLSKGLFHRGMSQGGTALATWAVHKSPLKKAKWLAASIGCDNACTKEMIKCLKQRSAEQVIQNSYADSPILGFPLTPFAPVIEKKVTGAFLSDDPYKLLKSGNINDVPWLTGATTDEGILVLLVLNFNLDDINNRWETVLPYVLNYYDTIEEKDKTTVAQKVTKFYLDNKAVSDDNIQSFIKLFGDRFFHLNLEKSARLQAKMVNSPVYSYIYGYRVEVESNGAFAIPKHYGVAHGSDAQLLYTMKFSGITMIDGKLPKSDERIKEFLLDVVTSFAKNGKPNSSGITWEPVEHDGDFKHLFIHNDGIKMVSKGEIAPAEFWQSLPLREYDNAVLNRDEL